MAVTYVVSPQPLCGVILRLLEAFDDVLIRPLLPDCAVVARDAGVLLGLSGLDMQDGNPMFLGLLHQLFTDVFRTIVDPWGARLAHHSMIRSRYDEGQKTIGEIIFPTIGMTRSASREK